MIRIRKGKLWWQKDKSGSVGDAERKQRAGTMSKEAVEFEKSMFKIKIRKLLQ